MQLFDLTQARKIRTAANSVLVDGTTIFSIARVLSRGQVDADFSIVDLYCLDRLLEALILADELYTIIPHPSFDTHETMLALINLLESNIGVKFTAFTSSGKLEKQQENYIDYVDNIINLEKYLSLRDVLADNSIRVSDEKLKNFCLYDGYTMKEDNSDYTSRDLRKLIRFFVWVANDYSVLQESVYVDGVVLNVSLRSHFENSLYRDVLNARRPGGFDNMAFTLFTALNRASLYHYVGMILDVPYRPDFYRTLLFKYVHQEILRNQTLNLLNVLDRLGRLDRNKRDSLIGTSYKVVDDIYLPSALGIVLDRANNSEDILNQVALLREDPAISRIKISLNRLETVLQNGNDSALEAKCKDVLNSSLEEFVEYKYQPRILAFPKNSFSLLKFVPTFGTRLGFFSEIFAEEFIYRAKLLRYVQSIDSWFTRMSSLKRKCESTLGVRFDNQTARLFVLASGVFDYAPTPPEYDLVPHRIYVESFEAFGSLHDICPWNEDEEKIKSSSKDLISCFLQYLLEKGRSNLQHFATDELLAFEVNIQSRILKVAFLILGVPDRNLESTPWSRRLYETKSSSHLLRNNERMELLKVMDERLDLEEFRTLVFELGKKYHNLPGEGLKSKKRELIALFDRHQNLEVLLQVLVNQRSDLRDEVARIFGIADLLTADRQHYSESHHRNDLMRLEEFLNKFSQADVYVVQVSGTIDPFVYEHLKEETKARQKKYCILELDETVRLYKLALELGFAL